MHNESAQVANPKSTQEPLLTGTRNINEIQEDPIVEVVAQENIVPIQKNLNIL